MGIELRLPNITATTDKGQLEQIRSYLYQMAQELQFALNNADSSSSNVVVAPATSKGTSSGGTSADDIKKAQDTFDSIKSLIIKSADIVDAYYDEIDSLLKLSGEYVAQSDFGTYTEKTDNLISANSESITQHLSRIETIESGVDGVNDMIKTQKSYLDYGAVGTTLDDTGLATENAPGIEIGDFQTLDDGVTTVANQKYARFTAYGLELFGASLDDPVAYIKQYKLYITNLSTINAEISGTLTLGAFKIDATKGFNLKYIGKE